MRDLSVGDVVRTGAGYEPITSFLHAQRASQLDFLSFAFTEGASEFVLSAAHRVFLRSGELKKNSIFCDRREQKIEFFG
jgi:hypothetical protein